MITRAGVSEGAFFEVFPSVGECYRAAFDEGLGRLSRALAGATARERGWLERVRSGLVALLGFFDDQPLWGRLLLLETPVVGALTFECGQRLHDALVALIEPAGDVGDCGRVGRAGRSPVVASALTGELVVGGVVSVIRTTLLGDDAGRLVELAPSLMAFIVAPYLGTAAARAELEGKPRDVGRGSGCEPPDTRLRAISRAAELPIRATHRTMLVLRAIARSPYSNNREIAHAAGLVDEGQTSKLLARLESRGVIENVGVGAARGEPNAWLLTPAGRRAIEVLEASVALSGTSRPWGVRTGGRA